jgi:hypothetical protein
MMHLTAAAIVRELKVALRPKGNIYLTKGVELTITFLFPLLYSFT